MKFDQRALQLIGGWIVVAQLSTMCLAQALAPVPPAAPALPEFVPPPPAPPPPPPAPPEPPVKAPEIGEKGPDGKLLPLAQPPEWLALSKMELSTDAQKRLAEVMQNRQSTQDGLIVQNPAAALSLRKSVQKLEGIDDIGELLALAQPINSVSPKPALEQAIVGASALSPQQVEAFRTSVRNYRRMVNEQTIAEAGGNTSKIAVVAAKASVRDRVREPMVAFNRMLRDVASRWSELKGLVPPGTDITALEAGVMGAGNEQAKLDAVGTLLEALPAEAQSAILGRVATPALAPMAPGGNVVVPAETPAATPAGAAPQPK